MPLSRRGEVARRSSGAPRFTVCVGAMKLPAAIECKWLQTVPLVPLGGGEPANFMVIGQVVSIYVDDRFVRDGRVDTGAMRPILRGGYFDYFTAEAENRFELRRPKGG